MPSWHANILVNGVHIKVKDCAKKREESNPIEDFVGKKREEFNPIKDFVGKKKRKEFNPIKDIVESLKKERWILWKRKQEEELNPIIMDFVKKEKRKIMSEVGFELTF